MSLKNREYKTIIVFLVLVIVLLIAIISLKHLQPPATEENVRQPIGGNKDYNDNPKRKAYVEQRDSFYDAAEEYYRKQKDYYRKRTEHYKNLETRRKSNEYSHEIRESQITDKEKGHSESKPSGKFTSPTVIDPNTADSLTLCRIPGIGKTISANIIRYRDRLGGFVSKEQLLECKYFTEDLLEWFDIGETLNIKKININKASYAQLIAHPYIGKQETQSILNYRSTYGKFANAETLRVAGVFDDAMFEKVIPYIEF